MAAVATAVAPSLPPSLSYGAAVDDDAGEIAFQSALSELSQLQELASAASAAAVEPPVGEVTEAGDLRLIRISENIEAVLETEEPAAAAKPVWYGEALPDAARSGIEILSGRCAKPVAEGFRKLRERLIEEQGRWLQAGRQLNSVAVVSPRRASGRSVIARNLAGCLAMAPDGRVLLVDADPRNPSLHRRLRIPVTPGLAEAARAGSEWRQCVRRVPESGLHVLTLGALGAGADGIDDTLLSALLAEVRTEFSWVILDSPSMETADGEMLARLADGSLLVLRNGVEYFDEAGAAVRRLDPARLLGAVLNFAQS